MKILIILIVLINLFVSIEAKKKRIYSIPYSLKKDLWMTPKDGILISENTPVYRVKEGTNGHIRFFKIQNLMGIIKEHLLNSEKYLRASADNINNSTFFPPPNYSIPIISSFVPTIAENSSDILYPRILVVIANDLFRKLGNKFRNNVPYILAFWNGVDMLFRSIENPRIRLNIAGIIFEAENYILNYMRLDATHYKHIDGAAIHDAKIFWHDHKNQIALDSYDTVVTMTSRNLCAKKDGNCDDFLESRSWPSSMCSNDTSKNETNKVIIIQDNGKFIGILPAAVELAVALGIKYDHDETFQSPEELEVLPNCKNVSSGYIMGPDMAPTAYQKRWSQCSLDQLTRLNQRNLACLRERPAGEPGIPRLLPGKLTTFEEQCKSNDYYGACQKLLRPCQLLECVQLEGDDYYCYEEEGYTAPEGTPCSSRDPNKFCMFGRCMRGSAFTNFEHEDLWKKMKNCLSPTFFLGHCRKNSELLMH